MNWGRVLVVGAHPDDLEMNAGGTIHKLARHSCDVAAVSLTGSGVREAEARAAQERLYVRDSRFLGGTDTRIACEVPELVARLDQVVSSLKPRTVVTHFHSDTHQDHAAAYKIVMAAARNVPNVLLFKPTYPSGRTDIPFHPSLVVKLDAADMESKIAAMREFKSQEVKYGYDLWVDSLRQTAAGDAWTYGGFHGHAELFQISRMMV